MFFFIWGVFIWFVATLTFRLFGASFFDPANTLMIVLTFILVVPLVLTLTIPLYYLRNKNREERLKAAISIAVPGMLIDVFAVVYFEQIFTNLPAGAAVYFGSWLLWSNALILLTGLVKGGKQVGKQQSNSLV